MYAYYIQTKSIGLLNIQFDVIRLQQFTVTDRYCNWSITSNKVLSWL